MQCRRWSLWGLIRFRPRHPRNAARLIGTAQVWCSAKAPQFLRWKTSTSLANEVRRSRRLEHAFTLLMLDVDHFKGYNDAYGHLAGDAALARVAAVLKESTRDVDCAARYGGEEFVVLLPETEAAGATETAQRIQARLTGDELVGGKLTLSVGVAQFPDDGESPEDLLAGADAALYQAKREGRNRVLRAAR